MSTDAFILICFGSLFALYGGYFAYQLIAINIAFEEFNNDLRT